MFEETALDQAQRTKTINDAWPTAALGEILDQEPKSFIQTGPFGSQLHAHEYVNDGVPVVMPQDIGPQSIVDASIARISVRKARELRRHSLLTGDVVLARRGDLTRCALVAPNQEGWLCGTGCLLVRITGQSVLPEWLTLVYREAFCQKQIYAAAVGSTMANLNAAILKRLQIPLPPPHEQHRIAEILYTVDDQIGAGEALVTKLMLLRNAIVRQQLQLSNGTDYFKVADFFEIQAGITLGPLRKATRHPRRYLRVANVQRGYINLSDIASIEATPADERKYGLTAGDLLVVEGHANPEEIGRCAMVRDDAEGLLYQNHLFRLRSHQVEQEFGEIWLNSDTARSYWRRMCATSSGLYTINSRLLAHLPFPEIDHEEQVRIVQIQRTTTSRIAAELENLTKLRSLKQGLTDDLLLGRGRVPTA